MEELTQHAQHQDSCSPGSHQELTLMASSVTLMPKAYFVHTHGQWQYTAERRITRQKPVLT